MRRSYNNVIHVRLLIKNKNHRITTMVLDKLGSSLKDTFKKIAGLGVVDKEAVERIVLDLQRSLLQADVDVTLVSTLSKNLKEKVLKSKPPAGLTLKEFFIKTLYDELVYFLGAEKGELELKKQKIMLVGLFGSGKTTVAKYLTDHSFISIKLSSFLKEEAKKRFGKIDRQGLQDIGNEFRKKYGANILVKWAIEKAKNERSIN